MDSTLLGRLLPKFAVSDECWEWTGAHTSNGYGQIRRDGKAVVAHKVVYELAVGPVPEGLDLDHLCSNRGCVNPDHLEPVTHAENIRRGRTGIHQRNKTHCPAGHPYQRPHLGVTKTGGRYCKTCKNEGRRRG